MYKTFFKRTLEEVAEALNRDKVDKDNIIYIQKMDTEMHYKVLYYKQIVES